MKTTTCLLFAAAALAGGCASGGGGAGQAAPAPSPAAEPSASSSGGCGIYAIFDYWGACGPSDEERLEQKMQELGLVPKYTPPFTTWSALPPTEGSYNTEVQYQFDTLSSGLRFTESSKRAAGYTYDACITHVRWGRSCEQKTVAPVPGGIASTNAGETYASTKYGPDYDGRGNLHTISRFSRFGATFDTLAPIGQPAIDVALRNVESWEVSSDPSTRSLTHFSEAEVHEIALAANPYRLDWSYQSFGVWTGLGGMETSSFGAATPASAVPAAGQAQFKGKLAGLYVSPAGQGSSAVAELTVNANFSSRSLTFASSGTAVTRDFKTSTAAPNLNISGTLSYSPASNTFTGTLTNAGATMAGSSTGRYYGPAAQEMGGVFSLKSSASPETFAGAYGAKR